MKIYFVRHGKTSYNGPTPTITGQKDIPLSEDGVQEAESIASEIPRECTTMYSSDLERCRDTAQIINKKLEIPLVLDARLRERDFGSLTGSEWFGLSDEMREKDIKQEYDYRPYGGEFVDDVKARVFASIEDIRKNQNGKDVLVVTHAGVIRLLLHFLANNTGSQIHNASVHLFEFPDTLGKTMSSGSSSDLGVL